MSSKTFPASLGDLIMVLFIGIIVGWACTVILTGCSEPFGVAHGEMVQGDAATDTMALPTEENHRDRKVPGHDSGIPPIDASRERVLVLGEGGSETDSPMGRAETGDVGSLPESSVPWYSGPEAVCVEGNPKGCGPGHCSCPHNGQPWCCIQ